MYRKIRNAILISMVTSLRVNMGVNLITIFVMLASGAMAGYLYPKPEVPFELPTNIQDIVQQQQDIIDESFSQSHESTVSYSLPVEDYHYLKQHKLEAVNGHKSNIEQHINDATSHLLEEILKQYDSVQTKPDVTLNRVITNQFDDNSVTVQNVIKQTESIHNNNILSVDDSPVVNQYVDPNNNNVLVPNTLSESEITLAQNNIVQNSIQPLVTKDIYFHVPPPDLEEPPVYHIPEPPRKIYKIIFVKVPSQDSSNNAQIQQAINNQVNQNAAIEDKTLIYVLVNKPEPVQILPPPPSPQTPSEHEVLFVNYKDNQISAPLSAQ